MILVDANLLLYAYDASSEQHGAAKRWLEETLSGPMPVRFAWVTLLAFLRIGTHSRVFAQPLSVAEATEIVNSWLVLPQVGILDPGERHWALLAQLLASAQARGNLVTYAHLAALALEHGATLVSTDRDFARFDGLRFMNPLDA